MFVKITLHLLTKSSSYSFKGIQTGTVKIQCNFLNTRFLFFFIFNCFVKLLKWTKDAKTIVTATVHKVVIDEAVKLPSNNLFRSVCWQIINFLLRSSCSGCIRRFLPRIDCLSAVIKLLRLKSKWILKTEYLQIVFILLNFSNFFSRFICDCIRAFEILRRTIIVTLSSRQ